MGSLLKTLIKIKHSNFLGLQRTINAAYYAPETMIINMENFDYITVDGFKFKVNDQIDSVQRVKDNSWFANIRPNDVALDIGANIGAITIPLAKIARKVIAVEPIFTDELAANVKLNDLYEKVHILPVALGTGTSQNYKFGEHERISREMTFKALLDMVGSRVDFLKVDCEGAEWEIKPSQCQGIRELRFEFHIRKHDQLDDEAQLQDWRKWLIKQHYQYTFKETPHYGLLNPFAYCALLNASWKGE